MRYNMWTVSFVFELWHMCNHFKCWRYHCLVKIDCNVNTVLVTDPPANRPIITQVKPGPVDSGDTVYLHCSVYGGNPIAKIIWDCQGKIKDQSSDTLSAVILELVVDRSYDDKICSCTATHRDPSYKHTIQHKLIVYCK